MRPHTLYLEVTSLLDGKYQIAARLPSGDTSRVTTAYRIRTYEVGIYLEILSRPIHNITPLEEAKIVRQFGQKLFNFLIGNNPPIYTAYIEALRDPQGLRLALALERAGELAHLPWELLCDPKRDFLTLSSSVSLVRTASHLSMPAPIPVVLPFRVLVIIAARNSEQDWRQLSEAAAALQANGHLKLERLHPTSNPSLRLHLLEEDYHIIHYIGTSQLSFKDVLTTDNVSREYYPESTVRLLIAQHTATTAAMKASFPAIATLQYPIGRPATTLFLREFYGALTEGCAVDSAIGHVRRAIANQYQTGEWAAPVLIVHPQIDVLFRPVSDAGTLLKQSVAR